MGLPAHAHRHLDAATARHIPCEIPSGSPRMTSPIIPFTYPFNISGPAGISLPLGWSDDGLPIGVQLVGHPFGEALILALAAQDRTSRPGSRYPAPLRGYRMMVSLFFVA